MQLSKDTNEHQSPFDSAMEEYNTCKLHYESLPKTKVEKGKKFDTSGYKTSQSALVRMDLALANVVRLRQKDVKFLTVERHEGATIMLYNPFGDALDELTSEQMTYTYVTAPDKKTKTYTKAANDSINWCYKVMTGDINEVFLLKLREYFGSTTKNITADFEDFCKTVSHIIRSYPHEELKTYEDYLAAFFRWFCELEEDTMMRMKVLDKLLELLRFCFFPDKREQYEKDGSLNDQIRMFAPTLLIQDCSKACHEGLKNLRFGSEKNKNFLDTITTSGLQKKAILDAKMKNLQGPKLLCDKSDESKAPSKLTPAVEQAIDRKRKREEQEETDGEGNDQPPKKMQKKDKSVSNDDVD